MALLHLVEREKMMSWSNEEKNSTLENKEWVPFNVGQEKTVDHEENSSNFELMLDDNISEESVAFTPLVAENEIADSGSEDVSKSEKPDNTIIDATQVEIEKIEDKAYKAGFQKGEKEGYEQGTKKGFESGEKQGFDVTQKSSDHLLGILTKIDNLWDNLIQENEEKIIQLICRVAEKVIYGQVNVDNEMVKKSILNAFKMTSEPVDVKININPDDYEYIENIRNDFFEEIKGLKNVEIISNQVVSRGGCTIESESGTVDAQIETRLEAIKRSIIDAVPKK